MSEIALLRLIKDAGDAGYMTGVGDRPSGRMFANLYALGLVFYKDSLIGGLHGNEFMKVWFLTKDGEKALQ